MSTALDIATELTVINCGECGGTYAINSRYHEQKFDYGGYWHCPYCQCLWGFGNSMLDAVKKQLQKEQMRARTLQVELEQQKHQTRAEKAAKTRIKNRIHKGVCPHCKRYFQNLQRHMETKHPKECKHHD